MTPKCSKLYSYIYFYFVFLARKFAVEKVGPLIREMDEKSEMDKSVIRGLFDHGVSAAVERGRGIIKDLIWFYTRSKHSACCSYCFRSVLINGAQFDWLPRVVGHF